MGNIIYTIGREFGSGGKEIGQKLADRLGIPLYDKELLQKAAKDSGFCEEIFENHDERPTNSFLYSLVMDTYSAGNFSAERDLFFANWHNSPPFQQRFLGVLALPAHKIGRCST